MAVRGNNSLHFATGMNNKGLKGGVEQAVKMIQGMSNKIASINPFISLGVAATAAFGAIAKDAYKLSKEFEQAMKEVQTISEATQQNFKGISNEVFKLSNITTDSPVKLAKAYYQIVSAGYDGAKGLKLLEVSAKAATAGVTDTMTAADGITTVLNAFRIEAEQSERVADILFQTVKLGKTNFEELAQNMATVAPIASASGIEFTQIASAIASLTKQGVPTAQAMTQIRSAIVATNEVLEDGWSKSMTLQEAFQAIYDKANGSQSALREMLGRVEAVNAVLGVSGENAKMASDDLKSYNDAVGAMNNANERMLSSNTNQWELFTNKIKVSMHNLGDSILESSSWIAESINEMMTETSGLTDVAVQASVEFDNLRAELEDANTEFERKKEILAQLKNQYPDYLKSLDLDKVKEDNLTSSLRSVSTELDKINDLMRKRIEIAGYQDILSENEKNAVQAQRDVIEQETKFVNAFNRIQEIAKKNNIEIGLDVTDAKKGNFENIARVLNSKINKEWTSITKEATPFLEDIISSARALEVGGWDQGKALYEIAEQTQKSATASKQALDKAIIQKRDIQEWAKEVDATKTIDQLNNIKSLYEKNTKFSEAENKTIEAKIAKRKEVVSQLEAISQIEKENASDLAKFEKTKNEEVQKAIEAKKASFRGVVFKTDTDESDYSFADELKERQEQYENYERVKNSFGEEYANKQYERLLQEGADFRSYLLQKLQDVKGYKDKEAEILKVAEKERYRGFKDEKTLTGIDVPNTIPVKVSLVQPDEQSINDVESKIKALENKFKKATTQNERNAIKERIDAEQDRLDKMRGIYNDELSLNNDLYNSIDDLTLQQLETRRKALQDELSEIRLQLQREYQAEKQNIDKINRLKQQEQKAQEDLDATNQEKAEKTKEKILEISGALGDLAGVFGMFGNNEAEKVLNQLAELGEGAAELAEGIAAKDPAKIISGGIKTIKAAVEVEVVSDTAKFESQIEKLNIAIEKLDYAISKSLGSDKISNRIESINQIKELEKAAQKAYEAEQNARRQVKVLGIKVGSKGKGSGTDPEKLKEFQREAEEARRKAEELKQEIRELWVGTTRDSIVDSILDDLEKAKGKLSEFKEFSKQTFSEIVRDSIIQQFKREHIEKWVQGFMEEFAKLSDNEGTTTTENVEEIKYLFGAKSKRKVTQTTTEGDGIYDLTESEIQRLKERYNDGANNIVKEFNTILELIDSVSDFQDTEKKKKGIEGEIATKITEETGTIIAGIMRGQWEFLKENVDLSKQQLSKLNEIATNTSYNKNLVAIAKDIKKLKEALA